MSITEGTACTRVHPLKDRSTPYCIVACLLLWVTIFPIVPANPCYGQSAGAQGRHLSLDALQLLVSGVAFYPDPLILQIADAALHPVAVRQAAQQGSGAAPRGPLAMRMQERWPQSVKAVAKYPDLLQQLDEHLAMTVQLGMAFRTQPDDVWTAIQQVRAYSEQAATAQPASSGMAQEDVQVQSSAAYVRTLMARPAMAELDAAVAVAANEVHQEVVTVPPAPAVAKAPVMATDAVPVTAATGVAAVAPPPSTATTTVVTPAPAAGVAVAPAPVVTSGTYSTTAQVGPAGQATVQTAGTVTTVTGPYGAVQAGAGSETTTVTGPAGNQAAVSSEGAGVTYNTGTTKAAAGGGSVTATGPANRSVTATGSGVAGKTTVGDTTYHGAAGGGTVTTSTGQSVSGAGQVHGTVTQTDSGTSWNTQASAAGRNNNSGASGYAAHTGSGTVTGTGTGSYQGSTTVDTSKTNPVTTTTTAGGGQVSTTVSTAKGEKTYTAGDGQVTNKPQGVSSSSSAGKMAPPPARSGVQAQPPASQRSVQSAQTAAAAHAPAAQGSPPAGSARYSQVSPKQVQTGNAAMKQNWSAVDKKAGSSQVQSTRQAPHAPQGRGGGGKRR